MGDRAPIETTNMDGYGAEPFPWSAVEKKLAAEAGEEIICYLGTVAPDGTRYAAGIWPVWLDGDFWFASNLGSKKARNFAVDPRATLSMRLPTFDVTFRGVVSPVTDADELNCAAERFRKDGWPVEVQGDAFTAPFAAQTAGPSPWHLFRFRYLTVVALQRADPGGAMRWRFSE